MVADAQRGDIGTHRLDHTGTLVAQDEGAIEWEASRPVHHMQVAVAHAGGDGAHQHLASPRPVEFHLLDGQRFMHLAEDGGGRFHC